MKCYKIEGNRIVLKSCPLPTLKASEVLVKVDSIGINRADLMQIKGKYPSPDGSDIPGLEVSGIRTDTGERVAAMLASGGYAEYVAVRKSHLIPLPDSIDFTTGASLPEALAVTWQTLYLIGKIKNRDVNTEKILIHGGASGVGNMMVQFALNEGFTVYTTARSIKKLAHFAHRCHIMSFDEGFDEYISYHGKVGLIVDILGGEYFDANLSSCNYGAKIIVLAMMSGRNTNLDLGALLMKNISIIGSTLRSKSDDFKDSVIANVKDYMLPKIINHSIKPIISQVFPFSKMDQAHDYLRSGENIGKIIVQL